MLDNKVITLSASRLKGKWVLAVDGGNPTRIATVQRELDDFFTAVRACIDAEGAPSPARRHLPSIPEAYAEFRRGVDAGYLWRMYESFTSAGATAGALVDGLCPHGEAVEMRSRNEYAVKVAVAEICRRENADPDAPPPKPRAKPKPKLKPKPKRLAKPKPAPAAPAEDNRPTAKFPTKPHQFSDQLLMARARAAIGPRKDELWREAKRRGWSKCRIAAAFDPEYSEAVL